MLGAFDPGCAAGERAGGLLGTVPADGAAGGADWATGFFSTGDPDIEITRTATAAIRIMPTTPPPTSSSRCRPREPEPVAPLPPALVAPAVPPGTPATPGP